MSGNIGLIVMESARNICDRVNQILCERRKEDRSRILRSPQEESGKCWSLIGRQIREAGDDENSLWFAGRNS